MPQGTGTAPPPAARENKEEAKREFAIAERLQGDVK
jgi:hypothetical protein